MGELSLNRIMKNGVGASLSKFYGVWTNSENGSSSPRNRAYYPLYLKEKSGSISHTVNMPGKSFVSDNIYYAIWDAFRSMNAQKFNNDELFFGRIGLFGASSVAVSQGSEITGYEFVAKTDYIEISFEKANDPVDISLNVYNASNEYIGRLDLTVKITRNASYTESVYFKIDWEYTGQTSNPTYVYLFPVGEVVICGEE